MTEQIDGIQLVGAFTHVTEHITKSGDDALKRDWLLIMHAFGELGDRFTATATGATDREA